MNKRTKIAVIGTRGIPATYGGIEKHCEDLYSILCEEGYEVTVYSRSYYTDNIKEYKGIKIKRIPIISVKGFDAFVHSLISTVIATLSDADIIHFHAQGPALFSIIPAVLSPKKLVVFTCHGIDWQRDKWNFLAKTVIKLGEKASAVFPQVKIGVSSYLADYYKQKYSVNMEKVFNGVAPQPKKPLSKLKEKFNLEEKGYFLFVGRLVPEKAPDILIEAFKKLDTEKKLIIVGGSASTDDYNSSLLNLAKDDERIIFTDYLYGEDLQEVYSNAIGYVTASKLEGLPITVLEAMSYGLPCLMSDIGPHNEIFEIDKTASISFKTNDNEACTAAMKEFLNRSADEIEQISIKAQDVVKTHFSWHEAAKKTSELYQSDLQEVYSKA